MNAHFQMDRKRYTTLETSIHNNPLTTTVAVGRLHMHLQILDLN